MATVNVGKVETQGLRTGLELTAAGIAALLGDPNETNVIEARKVSAFVNAMRADPTSAAILTGGKSKKGELHPVVAAMVARGYQKSSAVQYRSKMLAIRNAYVLEKFVPADGMPWNDAYEAAREVTAKAKLNNAVRAAKDAARLALPIETDPETVRKAMADAEAEVIAEGGNTRAKQTLQSFCASIIKRCERDGYDLGELIGQLQEVYDAVQSAPMAAEVKAPQVARRVANVH